MVRVVLVRPKFSGNVGSVARAMRNFGASQLALVGPRDFDLEEARKMAVHAADLVEGRQTFASTQEAVADCQWVVGTSGKRGHYRERMLHPREAAARVAELDPTRPVALVFGPEDTGLSNDDLRACQELILIPTTAEYTSLNLSQAVLLCLWELNEARPRIAEDPPALADAAAVDRMLGDLQTALLEVGFLAEENPEHILHSLRRIFGRARLDRREAAIFHGIARQVSWYANAHRDE